MATCRRILNLSKSKKNIFYSSRKFYSTSAEVQQITDKNEIVVPYKIHRGPTDILKALASTVSKDFTAPNYKYEDDPYLIPASNVSKRAFALSKESGRKAARYFLEKYPELFLCNKSVPHIKAFNPPTVYTEENVSSENVLIECIKNFEVNNSMTVYQILKHKGITVSQEVQQDLLELLCFYNGSQPPDEDYYEERYFQRRDVGEKWNAKGPAERLFEEMEKDSKAYSAMIAGAGKFLDAERAQYLFEEMTGKGLVPSVEAYNSLISVIPIMKERRETGSEYSLFMLEHMKKDGLVPNLYTMNAVLEVMLKRRFRRTKEMSLNVLAEMKRLNIEPSLGTYSLILSIFCEDNDSEVGALYEVINELEGKELTARHPLDVTFFSNAMEKCWKFAQDKNLAYRLNKIVEFKHNCKLLGNAIVESQYFKCFIRLLTETEDLDKFMEIYEKYVPNTYVPEPSVMLEIFNNVHFSGSYKYLPKLCSDVYVFEQSEREAILSVLMEAAGCMKHEKKIQEELVDVVWKIVEKINTRLETMRYDFSWNGSVLGNAINTFINGEDLEKSWSLIEKLGNEKLQPIGVPEKDTFLKFCELCLLNKEYDKAKFCIRYVTKEAYPEFGADFQALTKEMSNKEIFTARQWEHVAGILKSVSLENKSETSSDSSSSDSSSSDSSSSDEEDNK